MRLCLAAALVAAFSLPAGDAEAARVCGPRETIAKRLADGYGERPAAAGVTRAGSLIELYVAPSGSFTLVVTRPDGLACLLAAGEGWGRTRRPASANDKET